MLCPVLSPFHFRFVGQTIFDVLVSDKEKYNTVMTCEADARKQQWITGVVHQLTGSDSCCFKDMATLNRPCADCAQHKKECDVPEPDGGERLTVCGFSCKALSTMNSHMQSAANKLEASSSSVPNTSLSTLKMLLEFLECQSMPYWLGENHDELGKMFSETRHTMMELLGEYGFVADTCILDASEFGALTSRKRAFIVALHCERLGITVLEARRTVREICTYVDKFKINPLCEDKFFLAEGDEYFQKELERVEEKLQQPVATDEKGSKWQPDLMNVIRKHHLVYSKCQAPEELLKSPWIAALPSRDKSVLGLEMRFERRRGARGQEAKLGHRTNFPRPIKSSTSQPFCVTISRHHEPCNETFDVRPSM